MNCPICNAKSKKMPITHLCIKNAQMYHCEECSYSYVDCSNYQSSDIYEHQSNHTTNFGNNLQRNSDYVTYLKSLSQKIEINNLLEIGTPKNHDFLSKVYTEFNNKITLYSYDVIENDLPNYINFYKNKSDLKNVDIDILFCIHTLEHIPTNELKDFVKLCKEISKHFVFEVPYCKSKERIKESATQPHYSFFTEKSIRSLFGDVNIEIINNNAIKFNNIK